MDSGNKVDAETSITPVTSATSAATSAVTSASSAIVMADLEQRRKQLKPMHSNIESRRMQAVCVRNAYKSYGSKVNKNIVLDGLNMTVPRNTIYGLLGASGCGKTTLLSCIVGRRQLDSGEIWVMGGRPGSKGSGIPGPKVGYMPQEIALFGEFTIRETLLYFGWIAGMTTKEIDDKLQFLSHFLLLPSKNSLVKELSGGQQRRVSLSVALVHDPELLILDEPTVGVDPILRANIWEHLLNITKKGDTTIIVTTHYIDEMKQADCIGLMRGGYFLAEESPQKLMQQIGTDNLEEVYLKLSVMQNSDRARRSPISEKDEKSINMPTGVVNEALAVEDENHEISGEFGDNVSVASHPEKPRQVSLILSDEIKVPPPIPPELTEQMTFWDNIKVFNSKHLGALIWKNFLWMWRNKPVMAFMLLLPVVQMTMFVLSIGGDPREIQIAVKNYEIADVTTTGCPVYHGCNNTYLSCRYLQYLEEKRLIMKYFETEDEAIDYVRKGHSYAALVFSANYSKALQNRIDEGRDVSDIDVDNAMIQIHEDKSNMQVSLLLWKNFHLTFFKYIREYLKSCDYPPQIVDIPMRFNTPVYGSTFPNYTDFAAPGAILTMAFFLAMAISAVGMIIERNEGSYDRLAVQGVNEVEMLFSHIATDTTVVIGQCIILLIITFPIFNLTNEGSMVTIFFLTLLTSFSGMGFGFLVSCFCDNEQTAAIVGLGTLLPVVLLCGMIWPLEAMYPLLKIVSYFLPLTKTTESLRAILHRGWTMDRPVVYQGFIFTFGWIVFFLLMCLISLKLKKKVV